MNSADFVDAQRYDLFVAVPQHRHLIPELIQEVSCLVQRPEQHLAIRQNSPDTCGGYHCICIVCDQPSFQISNGFEL